MGSFHHLDIALSSLFLLIHPFYLLSIYLIPYTLALSLPLSSTCFTYSLFYLFISFLPLSSILVLKLPFLLFPITVYHLTILHSGIYQAVILSNTPFLQPRHPVTHNHLAIERRRRRDGTLASLMLPRLLLIVTLLSLPRQNHK